MKIRYKFFVVIYSLFMVFVVSAEPARLADDLILHAEQWETVRHGEKLINVPVLKKAVLLWSKVESQNIEIQYPGGEEGELWVQELIDWLISLGIPSKYLLAVPGSGKADIIRFKIIRAGVK